MRINNFALTVIFCSGGKKEEKYPKNSVGRGRKKKTYGKTIIHRARRIGDREFGKCSVLCPAGKRAHNHRSHFGQDAAALHKDYAGRQGEGGNDALRFE